MGVLTPSRLPASRSLIRQGNDLDGITGEFEEYDVYESRSLIRQGNDLDQREGGLDMSNLSVSGVSIPYSSGQ